MPEYSEFPFNAYLEERSKINDKQQAQNAQIPNIVGNLVTGAAEGAISTLADKAAAKKAKIAQITDTLQENYDYIPFDDKGNRGTTPDPEGATEAIQGLTNDGHHIAKQANGSIIHADANKKQLGVFVPKAKPSAYAWTGDDSSVAPLKDTQGNSVPAGTNIQTPPSVKTEGQIAVNKTKQSVASPSQALAATKFHVQQLQKAYEAEYGKNGQKYFALQTAQRVVDRVNKNAGNAANEPTYQTSKAIVDDSAKKFNAAYHPDSAEIGAQTLLKKAGATQGQTTQPQTTQIASQAPAKVVKLTPAQTVAVRKMILQAKQKGIPDATIAAQLKEKGVDPSTYGLQGQ